MVEVSMPSSRLAAAAKSFSPCVLEPGLYLSFICFWLWFSARSRHEPGALFLEDSLGCTVRSLLLFELAPQLRIAAEKPTRSNPGPFGHQIGGLVLQPPAPALLALPARGEV